MPSRYPGVIVASYGRSGSTLLYRAVIEAMCAARFGKYRNFVAEESWTLGDKPLRSGLVYKTHDYPTVLAGRNDLRTLFVFGSARDAVLSVIEQEEKEGHAWIDEHLEHLKAQGPMADILERDILGIGSQLSAWAGFAESPVLCLRYEALWDAEERIREFTGLPVVLPPRRARSEKSVPEEVRASVERVYGPLDERIDQLPDVFQAAPSILAAIDPTCAG